MRMTPIDPIVLMSVLMFGFGHYQAAPGTARRTPASEQNTRPALGHASRVVPRTSPYARLFRLPTEENQTDAETQLAAPIAAERARAGSREAVPVGKPRVVCGLTIIEGEPALDPKIRIVVPADGIDHRIRRISPPVCTE